MDKFEYVVGLAAVITGVGLSDIAVSLHRLLKRRVGVAWDWMPIAFALYAGAVLMRLWYQLWLVRDRPEVTGLPFVSVQVVQTLVLVLVASAALPDDDDFADGQIDLRDYYAAQGRYAWTAYGVFILMWLATALYFMIIRDGWVDRFADPYVAAFFLPPLVLTGLALVTGRRWQGVMLGLLIVHELLIPLNLLGLR